MPTVYLDDGRVVNSCSVDPRCTGQALVVNGSYRQASIERTASGTVITTPTATLTAPSTVTRLHFSDGVVALDLDGNAGQAYRLYQAAFNRKPDLEGLGYWIRMMDTGAVRTLNDVAHHFYHSEEFRRIYGTAPSYPDLITRYYRNALQREPDAGGFAYWLDILNRRILTPAQVLAAFSESPENKSRVLSDITNGFVYTPYGNELPPVVEDQFRIEPTQASFAENGATVAGIIRLEVRGQGMQNVELLPPNGYTPRLGVFNLSEDRTRAWLDFDTRTQPDGPIDVRISAFNRPAGRPDATELVAMPARRWNIRNAPVQPQPPVPLAATVTVAPPMVALLNGTVRLEVRGSGMENVELVPVTGSERYGSFLISPDKTHATFDLNANAMASGVYVLKISAYDRPAGTPGAREVVAMDYRIWEVRKPTDVLPGLGADEPSICSGALRSMIANMGMPLRYSSTGGTNAGRSVTYTYHLPDRVYQPTVYWGGGLPVNLCRSYSTSTPR
ncbi:DUF4214 domain-containing protein [Noviherbaspirillum aerium]|uniref:DUF4214 domain-containing protein n=1 Tax=Noviherbaspirillum aerium TaxID=2588497 RepID=UPI00178C810F|nr:DUF4214 domain-containing protein [Noviherbaspirillum aerium]